MAVVMHRVAVVGLDRLRVVAHGGDAWVRTHPELHVRVPLVLRAWLGLGLGSELGLGLGLGFGFGFGLHWFCVPEKNQSKPRPPGLESGSSSSPMCHLPDMPVTYLVWVRVRVRARARVRICG